MTTKIHLTWMARLEAFCLNTIARAPTSLEFNGEEIIIIFEPSLSPADKAALNTALPDFIKKVWEIIVEEV